jgi:hypothetical protein
MGKEVENLPAVPDMISAADYFHTAGEQFLGEARSDAEARCRIFTVRDAKVDLTLDEDVREAVVNDLATGRANDVADEQDSHIDINEPFRFVITPARERSGPLRRALLGPEPHE